MQITDLLGKISDDLAVDMSVELSESSELLMSGIVDSLGVMNLVTWIEDHLQVEIDPGDVVIENFETPAAIMAFVSTLTSAVSP